MKFLRALAVLGIGLLAIAQTAPPGHAQTATPSSDTLRAARQLVAQISDGLLADATSAMTTQIWPPIEAALRAQNAKMDQATIDELRAELQRLMLASVAEILKEAPAIYARYFTAKELNELTAFYRTPTGAKALLVMPKAMGDLYGLLAPRMQGLQEKVNLAFLNVLQKRGYYAQ